MAEAGVYEITFTATINYSQNCATCVDFTSTNSFYITVQIPCDLAVITLNSDFGLDQSA